jgi:hypothetical protein
VPIPSSNTQSDTVSPVWTEQCRSWYKAGSAAGKILALWPGSTLHYLEALKDPRWEDWDFTHSEQTGNRFTYLGNGHSSAEALGGDLSYYIRNKDDSPIDPVLKRVNPPNAPAEVKLVESPQKL